jgi:hypothetical protein
MATYRLTLCIAIILPSMIKFLLYTQESVFNQCVRLQYEVISERM